jgi:hypothetical protein
VLNADGQPDLRIEDSEDYRAQEFSPGGSAFVHATSPTVCLVTRRNMTDLAFVSRSSISAAPPNGRRTRFRLVTSPHVNGTWSRCSVRSALHHGNLGVTRNLSRAPMASLRDRLRRPSTEPVRRKGERLM